MVMVVNNQPPANNSNGTGFVIGIILLIAVILLFIYYGVPLLRNIGGGYQVNVPSQINVNVHGTK